MGPWTPLVLSFDGGGVRGLSSLYILRRIMLRVRQLETEESEAKGRQGPENTQDSHKLPLPCHYFDHIVGTSTGG
jgi:patatin-like phospholipase/acyl hydrolase